MRQREVEPDPRLEQPRSGESPSCWDSRVLFGGCRAAVGRLSCGCQSGSCRGPSALLSGCQAAFGRLSGCC
eukprot:2325971-Prymnesium_polylepis.1